VALAGSKEAPAKKAWVDEDEDRFSQFWWTHIVKTAQLKAKE